MIYVQVESRSRHQPARHDRPGGDQPDERNHGKARPKEGGNADGDIEQSFEYQHAPAVFLAADGAHGGDDSGDAVDQHVG